MALQQFDPDLLSPRKQRRSVRFDAFPEGSWEVVWLGDVGFHTRRRTFSQPTVKVVLRALDQAVAKTVEIEVPVAQLFALHLGSIWRDKVRTEEQVCEVDQREVLVHGGSATQCMAGVMLEDGSETFMLPFKEHPYHAQHTKSWCVRVETKEALFVFPALELIRFYFGSSGALLKKVFRPTLEIAELATASHMEKGVATITLANDIPSASASDVARIVFDKAAQAAALLVGRSLLGASSTAAGARLYPRAVFPFKQVAQLQVVGRTIPSRKETFVVQRILSCAARFPFNELKFVASTKERRAATSSSDRTSTGDKQGKVEHAYSAGPVGTLRNDEPSVRTALKVVAGETTARFPDLLRKSRTRIDGETQRLVRVKDLPQSSFDATGRGTSSGEGRRADLTSAADDRAHLWHLKSPTPAWAPFFELVNDLSREPWVDKLSFVPLDSRQARRHYSRLPDFVDPDGVLLNRSVRDGSPQGDLLSLVNLEAKGTYAVLASLCPTSREAHVQASLYLGVRLDGSNALSFAATLVGGLQVGCRVGCTMQLSEDTERAAAVRAIRCAIDGCSSPVVEAAPKAVPQELSHLT